MRILKRMNLVEQDESGHDVVANNNSDSDDPLAGIQAASTQNKIALGIRKGQNVRRLIEQLEEQYLVKILTHLGLPARASPIAPSKIPRQVDFWDQSSPKFSACL